MWWGCPWNPCPLQSRPGLRNVPTHNQVNNLGAFDQASVPPMWRTSQGIYLKRSFAHSGGMGWIREAQLAIAKEQFGERTGEVMWREFMRMEFAWNRDGVGNPGGIDRSYCLWIQEPTPQASVTVDVLMEAGIDPEDFGAVALFLSKMQTHFFCANMPGHGRNVFDEDAGQTPPTVNSWTYWIHSRLPVDPSFRPDEFSDKGFPVWAAECVPNQDAALFAEFGRWHSPYALAPMRLLGRSKLSKHSTLTVFPEWL